MDDPNMKIGTDRRLIGQTFWALDGIDLTIYQGERVGIIGANGAGKSTLLKLLSRVTAPTEGDIDVWGRVSSLLEVGTGFNGEMTGRENVYLNGAILGMTKKEIGNKIEDIIDFSEVRDFIDTPVKRYSSGMFVKLAFSVAAHLNSEILVMDEALAVGDMAFQKKCLDMMRKAAGEEGRTVLYVSHNMDTIRRLCDRVVVLSKGRVVYDGGVDEGIALYMDYSLGENEVDMDLAVKPHAGKGLDTGIYMKHLMLIDKVTPTYEESEPLRMRIRFDVTKQLENVTIRLTLRTDSDTALGTSWSKIIGSIHIGMHEAVVTLALEMVAKGTFYASIGFYQSDELGRWLMLDHITRAFKIEVIGKPVWNVSAYGCVKLPQMDVEIYD
jgi:lipopolysaccharide transport system ATP-binding protein